MQSCKHEEQPPLINPETASLYVLSILPGPTLIPIPIPTTTTTTTTTTSNPLKPSLPTTQSSSNHTFPQQNPSLPHAPTKPITKITLPCPNTSNTGSKGTQYTTHHATNRIQSPPPFNLTLPLSRPHSSNHTPPTHFFLP